MTDHQDWEDQVAFTLLRQPMKWRMRAVERIELSSHRWSVRNRRIHAKALKQVEELDHLLGSVPKELYDAPHEEVTLVLPLSQMTKNPVVDFQAQVNGQEVSRLSREEGARIQARYFKELVREATGIQISETLEETLTAVFGSTYPPKGADHESYVQEQLQLDEIHRSIAVSTDQQIISIKNDIIANRSLPKRESAAQDPLLALPYLNELRIASGEAALDDENLATRLREVKNFLNDLRDHGTADQLLRLYAEYGRHWEAFARCKVPLDRPFFITVATKRHIEFESPERESIFFRVVHWVWPVAWSHMRFADARSNHVNIRVPDINVEFSKKRCGARNNLNRKLEVPPEHEHKTSELFAIYSSRACRDNRLWVKTPLRLTWLTIFIHLLVIATILATLGVTWRVWGDFGRRLTAQQLALLLTPSTFAASLLLVRDSSPLGSKCTAPRRIAIAVSLATLWAGVLFLFGKGEIHLDEKKPTPTPSSTFIPIERSIGARPTEPRITRSLP
ncbi:hypothetical protein AB5L52_06730 [Streptomyces sp. CG4]|uniref:hypothetical protein n=1 Tax=Streptomyces sp. CG4 TaxID=408783 RepID=UPI0034E23914